MNLRRAPLLSVVALAACLLGPGCLGPTLPLPPPTALVEAPDASGMVDVTGEVLPDAYVLVLNLDTDAGVIGRADGAGRYAVRLSAASGHTLEVWQMSGVEGGQHRTVTVPAP